MDVLRDLASWLTDPLPADEAIAAVAAAPDTLRNAAAWLPVYLLDPIDELLLDPCHLVITIAPDSVMSDTGWRFDLHPLANHDGTPSPSGTGKLHDRTIWPDGEPAEWFGGFGWSALIGADFVAWEVDRQGSTLHLRADLGTREHGPFTISCGLQVHSPERIDAFLAVLFDSDPKDPTNAGPAAAPVVAWARNRPEPRMVKGARAAELLSAEWLRWMGFDDAHATNEGADAGVDVIGRHVVAQVKMEGRPTSRPQVQAFAGAAQVHAPMTTAFFSLAGYTQEAIEFAGAVDMALFEFTIDGDVEPLNATAWTLTAQVDPDRPIPPPPRQPNEPTITPYGTILPGFDETPDPLLWHPLRWVGPAARTPYEEARRWLRADRGRKWPTVGPTDEALAGNLALWEALYPRDGWRVGGWNDVDELFWIRESYGRHDEFTVRRVSADHARMAFMPKNRRPAGRPALRTVAAAVTFEQALEATQDVRALLAHHIMTSLRQGRSAPSLGMGPQVRVAVALDSPTHVLHQGQLVPFDRPNTFK